MLQHITLVIRIRKLNKKNPTISKTPNRDFPMNGVPIKAKSGDYNNGGDGIP